MTAAFEPAALSIAGSDPSAGAGIQADLKTFMAMGVYGATVITALTAQNTRGVTAIHAVPAAHITAQMDAIFDDLNIQAIKTGMLGGEEAIEAVTAGLKKSASRIPIIVDPVMVATSGDRLLAAGAELALRRDLIPLATLVTPNLPEAAMLLGTDEARDEAEAEAQARALLQTGAKAVLLKGGHRLGKDAVDFYYDGVTMRRFAGPRIATSNTHGTGCTLSSAIAAGLVKGKPLETAAADAKAFLQHAIATADAMTIGHGAGPVNHFAASLLQLKPC